METTTLKVSDDGQYSISKCVDVYHDYDGGTWYHIWDEINECIIFEDDDYNEVVSYFETM